MPLYEFICHRCDVEMELFASMSSGPPESVVCEECGVPTIYRIFSVGVQTPFREHYNKSVGKVVKSMAQFKSELRRASEHMEERTGIPHNYTAVDPGDGIDAHHITGDGLEPTRRRRYKLGDTKNLMTKLS